MPRKDDHTPTGERPVTTIQASEVRGSTVRVRRTTAAMQIENMCICRPGEESLCWVVSHSPVSLIPTRGRVVDERSSYSDSNPYKNSQNANKETLQCLLLCEKSSPWCFASFCVVALIDKSLVPSNYAVERNLDSRPLDPHLQAQVDHAAMSAPPLLRPLRAILQRRLVRATPSKTN